MRLRLNSVRYRLALLSFAITAAAVGFIYLYVVPQLSSSLTAERLRRLEGAVGIEAQRLAESDAAGAHEARLRSIIRSIGARADARATLLGVPATAGGPLFVIADSEVERSALFASYPAATAAIASGSTAAAVEDVGSHGMGQAAAPISDGTRVVWSLVLSSPLDEVEENVSLIQRQIGLAGLIALIAALIAAWVAASAHARRLSRLERAAERVAEGDFSQPIRDVSSDEVGQLARTFAEMQSRLERLDSARRDFIANASHELRTPLFSLGGFLELLEHEHPEPHEREAFLAEMRGQVERLTKLATDLLDLSRLDADVLDLEHDTLDAGALATQVAGEFEPQARRLEATIETPGPGGAVVADPVRLAQVIRILIDNALRHNPPGTTVKIEVKEAGERVKITVRDDGRGIPSEARARVFERFFSADPGSGSGLGLAIAAELADRMDGSVRLARARTGSTLVVDMPAAAGSAR